MLLTLLTLAEDINDYNKCFIMTADIDLAGIHLQPLLLPPIRTTQTVLIDGNEFTGIFNGDEHKITNHDH